jgi:uncharacterized protein YbjQ (UPF0145 family)
MRPFKRSKLSADPMSRRTSPPLVLMRRCLALATVLALAAPLPALAQGSPPATAAPPGSPPAAAATPPASSAITKVVAVHVEGKDTEMVAGDLVASLPTTVRVIGPDAFAEALGKAGQRGPIGAVLGQPKQRGRALARLKKAAAALGADALVVARARHDAGQVKVRLLWIDGADEPAVDEDLTLGGDEHARRALFAEKLHAPLARLNPAPAAAPTSAAPPPPPPPPPPPARTVNEVGSAILVASLGVTVRGRWFDYSDAGTVNLKPYSTFPAPGPALGLEVYPLAGTRLPILSDLGLTFAYARAFAQKPAPADFATVASAWDSLQAGLRYRLRVDDLPFQERPGNVAESVVFGFSGGVGWERFGFTATGTLATETPDVSYLYLHAGVDGRFPVSRVAVMVHARWLGALSAGAVYDRFREPHLGGVSVGGGVAVKVAGGFEIRVDADYKRWFASFSPKYADPYVAGGAKDEMLALESGLAYAY